MGSLDAEALYPLLDSLKVAKLCGRLATENKLAIENVDYVWAGAYIACNMHPEQVFREGLSDCVPRRRYTSGQSPKIGSLMKNDVLEK